jgi:hypothetical protein
MSHVEITVDLHKHSNCRYKYDLIIQKEQMLQDVALSTLVIYIATDIH